MGWMQRLSEGLSKTRSAVRGSLDRLLGRAVDPALLEEFEATLISSDLGVPVTSMAKLAQRLVQAKRVPLLVAADTFRAAAIEQLQVWADRIGVELVRHRHGADPAAVAYDGIAAAKARQADVVLIDTAGRLHTKSNLMEELRKVTRVIGQALPGAPHEVLLVLDATLGQNALAQARQFRETVGVTGVALTKLDGTAKGGIVVAIADELKLPVRLIGVGEGVEDLQDFEPRAFVDALLGLPAD
jgi:fused signal recognition particle receptor